MRELGGKEGKGEMMKLYYNLKSKNKTAMRMSQG